MMKNVKLAKNMNPKIEEALKIGLLQSPAEIELACELVSIKKPKVIVEIGSCAGGSAMLWNHFAQPEVLISIDDRSPNFNASGINYEKRTELFKKLKIIEIFGNSHNPDTFNDLIKKLDGKEIDMLFIDGDHTFDGVIRDYVMYSQLVEKKNGFIMFHDIKKSLFHEKAQCHVPWFWERLRGKLKVEIIDNNTESGGIGILFL